VIGDRSIDREGDTVAQYPGRPEFEANADRARESADTLLATSLVAEAASERHDNEIPDRPQGRGITALVDLIRSMLSGRERR
jgi:hypothetical protein